MSEKNKKTEELRVLCKEYINWTLCGLAGGGMIGEDKRIEVHNRMEEVLDITEQPNKLLLLRRILATVRFGNNYIPPSYVMDEHERYCIQYGKQLYDRITEEVNP